MKKRKRLDQQIRKPMPRKPPKIEVPKTVYDRKKGWEDDQA